MLTLALPVSAAALDGKVSELRAVAATVRAALELKDAFPDKLRDVARNGGTLHLRVETELWEDRPAWDRLVRPASVAVFRISRQPGGAQIAVVDSSGGLAAYPDYPNPLVVRVDVSPVDRIEDAGKYYLNAAITLGTLAEREIADAEEAVFGKDDGSVGLRRVGRFLLSTVLQITDYMQSVSAEIRSRKYTGREIRTR